MGGFAGAVSCAFPPVARAATAFALPTAAANRRFSVLYKRFKIGTHTVAYSSATGETQVKTDINLEVKLAFLTAYAFSHRSEETWRAGRLMSLNSDTVEHGEPLHVEGAATPQGFRVVSKGGPFIAPAATLTSNSLWTQQCWSRPPWSTRSVAASLASAHANLPMSQSRYPEAKFRRCATR
jgi:hypothetical protein